jgi:Na+-transporting methylmalonyl-CoA/oxaloacetate decarboxylase gamma subunit
MLYSVLLTRQELTEALTMIGTGFIVVMSVLCFLWAGITIIGKIFTVAQSRNLRKKTELGGGVNTHTSPAEDPHDGISATTLALIAAAVQTTVNGPYRILGVEHRHSNHEAEHQVSTWSVEGRRTIFSSHKVR